MSEEKKPNMPVLARGERISNEKMFHLAKYLNFKKLVSFENADEVFLALQVAFSLGMETIGDLVLAINNMYIVKGRVGIWGDLPMAIVQKSGQLEFIEEFFIDKNYKKICLEEKNVDANPICAVCRIKRKNAELKEYYLTLKDLEMSGNYSNGRFKGRNKMEIWNNYPKVMWAKRLKRWSIANSFSDVLKCVSTDDDKGVQEIQNTKPPEETKDTSKMIDVYSDNKKEEENKEEIKEKPEDKKEEFTEEKRAENIIRC